MLTIWRTLSRVVQRTAYTGTWWTGIPCLPQWALLTLCRFIFKNCEDTGVPSVELISSTCIIEQAGCNSLLVPLDQHEACARAHPAHH